MVDLLRSPLLTILKDLVRPSLRTQMPCNQKINMKSAPPCNEMTAITSETIELCKVIILSGMVQD